MWCLRENEVTILRTEKAVIRAVSGDKLIDKKE